MMNAEIITIGDEILIGQIVDSNSAFIAKALNKIGVSVHQISSVQDDSSLLLKAFALAESRVDLVITTGGLGPTKDDITKKTYTTYFGDKLIQNKQVLKNIEMLWAKHIKQPLMQVNIDQALVPSRAQILMNKFGSAPGIWMEQNNTVFVALPGVPYEMKALVNYQLIPKISSRFKRPFLLHKTLLTHGLGESVIAQRISDIESNLPKHIKLAYLPNLGRVRLRLSGKGLDELQLKLDVEQQVQKILPLLSDIFVGFEEDSSIETVVGKALVARSKTLALAESCTGGKIAERITSQPGVSAFFKGSIVAYSTASKINLLKVNPELINQHSVVSKSVAESMALKVKKMFESDYAIATTGNAGPSKGESDAELGTVFIAVATPEGVYSECFNFGTSRYRVIHKSVNMAFQMLQKEIFKN